MNTKKWLLVLSPDTEIGKAYLGQNDGMTPDGYPVIDCTHLEIHGAFFFCERNPRHPNGIRQSLLVPMHAVVIGLAYANEAERSVGFLASASPKAPPAPQ